MSLWKKLFGTNINEVIKNAFVNGNYTDVEQALTKGANANVKFKSGSSLLHQAAYNGDYSIVKLLLSKGANVNATTPRGATSLYGSAHQGEVEIVKLLVENGTRPSQFDLSESNESVTARKIIRAIVYGM